MGHQYCDSCNKFCEACAAARESELTALRAKDRAGQRLRMRLELDYHDLPASAQGAVETYDNATGWTMPGEDAAAGVE